MKFASKEIVLSIGTKSPKSATKVNAYVGKFFGFHPSVTQKKGSGQRWTITHLQSGLRVCPDWGSRVDAEAVAEAYETAFAEWWPIRKLRAELLNLGFDEDEQPKWRTPSRWTLFRDEIECLADDKPDVEQLWKKRKKKK